MHQHTFRVLLAAVLSCHVGPSRLAGRSHRTIHPSPEMEVVSDEFRTDDTVVENANTTGSTGYQAKHAGDC